MLAYRLKGLAERFYCMPNTISIITCTWNSAAYLGETIVLSFFFFCCCFCFVLFCFFLFFFFFLMTAYEIGVRLVGSVMCIRDWFYCLPLSFSIITCTLISAAYLGESIG